MSEPTICAKCRYYIPNPYGWYFYAPERCWHGCRRIEKIDFVTGAKSYPWDVYPVECGAKNNGECKDYEYDQKEQGTMVVYISEPKKHWWQR